MDTVTQALLGAAVGQAGFSQKLGRRALVWGAIGGLLPDLDVLVMAGSDPFAEFVYHRGFTHSLWFGPVAGPIIGWAIWKSYRWRGRDGPGEPGAPSMRRAWMALMALALFTHPLIDVFTSYGTQLFAPFSRERFALDAVGIVDFTYSGILIVGLVVGCFLHRQGRKPQAAALVALALSWSYLGYGWWLNERAETQIEFALAQAGHSEAEVNSYPTFVQPFLRRFVARSGNQIWVGFHTPLGGGVTRWEQFPATRPHPLVARLLATPRGQIFAWFAMGELSARVLPDPQGFAVEVDDLRYGFAESPQRGMWGIRGIFDPAQRPIGPVERTHPPRPSRANLGALWRAMWGDFSTFLGPGA
ncbi:MAG TPA: metal-dependent hydrolase [Myxococcales bacterium]|nr:metal-dependent hydrolase [Myxococcales bacterium]